MDINVVIPLLSNPKLSHKTQVIADCPFCAKPDHFFISRKTLHWDCKKCKEAGSINRLLHKLGKAHLISGERVVTIKNPVLSLNHSFESNLEEEEVFESKCRMPIGFEKLNYFDDNKYTQYLKKRKFNKIDFDLYSVGSTELSQKFDDYVLISVYNDYLLKGFVGRYIGKDKEKLRYLNSKSKFSNLLFGLDEINNKTKSLLLVEGPFDKISATTELGLHDINEFKCCCTFGNKISSKQISILKKYKNLKNIYLMYDARDSVNVMKHASLNLKREFDNVRVCYLPDSDPGDSDAERLMKSIDDSESVLSFYYNKVLLNKF